MENTRFLKTVIVLLVLLNFGLLAFLFLREPPHRRPEGPAKFLIESLNLDETQQEQYTRLRDAHQDAMRKFNRENGDAHRTFFDLLKNVQVDSTGIDLAAETIATSQKQMELTTFEHFRQLRAICRPDQQKKFDAVIDEALRIMRPPPPR